MKREKNIKKKEYKNEKFKENKQEYKNDKFKEKVVEKKEDDNNGYEFDETTGYFYNKELNMYYDGNSGLFFNPLNSCWCFFNPEKNQFEEYKPDEEKKEEKKENKKVLSGKFVPNPKFEQTMDNIEYIQSKKSMKNNIKQTSKVLVKKKKRQLRRI